MAGHGAKSARRDLGAKPEANTLRGRPRHKWEDNINES
jgi:hypothetical protein